jgi:hypothetical protein
MVTSLRALLQRRPLSMEAPAVPPLVATRLPAAQPEETPREARLRVAMPRVARRPVAIPLVVATLAAMGEPVPVALEPVVTEPEDRAVQPHLGTLQEVAEEPVVLAATEEMPFPAMQLVGMVATLTRSLKSSSSTRMQAQPVATAAMRRPEQPLEVRQELPVAVVQGQTLSPETQLQMAVVAPEPMVSAEPVSVVRAEPQLDTRPVAQLLVERLLLVTQLVESLLAAIQPTVALPMVELQPAVTCHWT